MGSLLSRVAVMKGPLVSVNREITIDGFYSSSQGLEFHFVPATL